MLEGKSERVTGDKTVESLKSVLRKVELTEELKYGYEAMVTHITLAAMHERVINFGCDKTEISRFVDLVTDVVREILVLDVTLFKTVLTRTVMRLTGFQNAEKLGNISFEALMGHENHYDTSKFKVLNGVGQCELLIRLTRTICTLKIIPRIKG